MKWLWFKKLMVVMRPCKGKILTLINMGLKQRRKTISNGDKWHKDGLNTDMDIANSSKCKLTLFEIQTREIHAPPPPPTPPKRTSVIPCTCSLNMNEWGILFWKWTMETNGINIPHSTRLITQYKTLSMHAIEKLQKPILITQTLTNLLLVRDCTKK